MAISKVILNGNTLMDVTQDTVQANNLLSGNTATKNDGTKVNGSVTQKSAQTYIPTTTDQTIASGQYLTGVQTIKGDANLLAENIKKGVVIFGITGTYEGDVPSGYTVTVSLTNPRNQSDFSSCNVIEAKSNAIDDPNNIVRSAIDSPDGSAEYEISSSSYGLFLTLFGSSVDIDDQSNVTITCTGGCSYSIVDVDTISVQVIGDGTITIDGVDYDY